MDAHLSSMMSKEMSDLFQTEIIKSLNDITLNGQRKIIAVKKYGNSIAVTLEAHKSSHKTTYSFGLASKLSEVVLDEVKKDPHEVSTVKCDLCDNQWVAVRPVGVDKLQCPFCMNMVYFENV